MHLIWHSRRGRRRNHLWQILWWSVVGCRFCGGSKIALSHWQSQWPLTQGWRYRAACDNQHMYSVECLLLRFYTKCLACADRYGHAAVFNEASTAVTAGPSHIGWVQDVVTLNLSSRKNQTRATCNATKAPSPAATTSKQHFRMLQVKWFFRQSRTLLRHCCRLWQKGRTKFRSFDKVTTNCTC